MKGIWLLPSRRRLEKLARFFDCAMENGLSTPGVVLVQKDELVELHKEYAQIKMPQSWGIMPTLADGLGDKCREVWPAIKRLDWVGLGCDDLRPQTHGWDKTLIERINGKNIVTCDDGQQGNLRMSGITVFSGGLLRAMGYMFPPGFWHTYTDNVWEEIGREGDCWTYVREVLILHDHPFRNQQIDPALADDTTYKSYGQADRDIAAYKHWQQHDKAGVIERVRAL